MREAMVFLPKPGAEPDACVKIFNRYKEGTRALLRENPYRMVEEVEGVGFRTADRVALAQGMAPGRARSACAQVCAIR